jgi:hypothetical protein
MAQLVGGVATSHAFALVAPERWDEVRAFNRRFYAGIWGREPEERPEVAHANPEDDARRYARVRDAHARARAWLEASADILVLIGDDQNENFGPTALPALAVYTGADFTHRDLFAPDAPPVRHQAPAALGEHAHESLLAAGFDVAEVRAFAGDELKAHAFGPVLRMLDPHARLAVLPVFVEAIHHPAPEPARCYAFGRALRRAIEAWDSPARVAVGASGGLSHFNAGYPFGAFARTGLPARTWGEIDPEFDHALLADIAAGRGERLARFTGLELLAHGEVELRSWITALGVLGDVPGEVLAYEPFPRGIMGMGVALWTAAG